MVYHFFNRNISVTMKHITLRFSPCISNILLWGRMSQIFLFYLKKKTGKFLDIFKKEILNHIKNNNLGLNEKSETIFSREGYEELTYKISE